ncbi:hypothetical protein CSKR_102628 [Clonorchis sinensis]|uniref:Uncharacterized protein n=1 Tax=Clonorchis sinensis TaxID=79923 RepID=A0A3R7JMX0_CLOSI|nr:hypothetical protein CSKR_102628 [Clonorchis sinensis]
MPFSLPEARFTFKRLMLRLTEKMLQNVAVYGDDNAVHSNSEPEHAVLEGAWRALRERLFHTATTRNEKTICLMEVGALSLEILLCPRRVFAGSRGKYMSAKPYSNRAYIQTIEQESKTLICIPFTKLNVHLLLECFLLNFSGYSLTVTQIQANATMRLRQFRNRSHFSRDAMQIYKKTYYSHASSVVSTVTPLDGGAGEVG